MHSMEEECRDKQDREPQLTISWHALKCIREDKSKVQAHRWENVAHALYNASRLHIYLTPTSANEVAELVTCHMPPPIPNPAQYVDEDTLQWNMMCQVGKQLLCGKDKYVNDGEYTECMVCDKLSMFQPDRIIVQTMVYPAQETDTMIKTQCVVLQQGGAIWLLIPNNLVFKHGQRATQSTHQKKIGKLALAIRNIDTHYRLHFDGYTESEIEHLQRIFM